jgi:hypothetical protein
MGSKDRSFMCAMVWLGLLLFAILAVGQASFQAQIRGVVRDQSGAVIPGAKVTITNVATNNPESAQTDVNGYCPATYTLTAEASGFQTKEAKDVVLAVSQQTTLDFTLVPAGIATSVTVTETAPLLDTGNSALHHDQRQLCA